MKINSYKKVSSNLYELTIDNGEKIKLYDEVILKYELLIDKKLTEKKLKDVLDANAPLESYYKALNYISKKMRTRLEIDEYLKKYDYDIKARNFTITRLQKEGYLNEERYIEAYINDSLTLGLNGPKKISSNLQKLGLDNSLIDGYISKVDFDIWNSRIKKIIEKKVKTNKNSTFIFKNKMYNELINLGYDSEMISDNLNRCNFSDESAFLKEADKIWNQLSKKYDGKELELKFKNKMFMKRYDVEDINSYVKDKTE